MATYGDIQAWLDDCKRTVRNDWDNGMLFTGAVGKGKSTIMFQVLRALDAGFDVDRCHFTVDAALRHAPDTPRYGAWALDEAHISGRKAMHGEMQRLNDYLQVCRGLNHHWALCFHQDHRVDKPIMERVRWNLHVPMRGIVQLRTLKENYVKTERPWRVLDAWRFQANKGRIWDEYGAKKDAHMRRLSEGDEEPEDDPAKLGFRDPDALVSHILAAL